MSAFLQELIKLDTSLFLSINGNNSPFWDFVMYWLSSRLVWIPLYLFLLFLLYKSYGKRLGWILLAVIILVTLSDQISVQLFKNLFHRLRPCHEPALEGLVHLVKGRCGGEYGFISSHAANTFALSVFLFPFLAKQSKWIALSIVFWATAVSYSRIYLGAHYPADVLAGAAVGILWGWVMQRICGSWLEYHPQDLRSNNHTHDR